MDWRKRNLADVKKADKNPLKINLPDINKTHIPLALVYLPKLSERFLRRILQTDFKHSPNENELPSA